MAGKFFQTLRDLRAGVTLDDLDSAIAEVVERVVATNKVGELVLKIKVRPPKKATANFLVLEDEVITKLPKHDRADTVFFPLSDHSLSRHDPKQMQIPGLRPVESVSEDGEYTFGQPLPNQQQQHQG